MNNLSKVQKNSNKRIRSDKKEKKIRLKRLVELRNRQSGSHPFYNSDSWLKIRYRILVKHGRKCQACGSEGLNIRFHVDHIKPRSIYPELQLEESNLQVLCEACNIGKSNLDTTDWRTNS